MPVSKPPPERPPGEQLEAIDLGTEEPGHSRSQLRGQLRLRRRAGVGIVNRPLDEPAKALGESIEVTVDPAQPGQADGPVEQAKAPRSLRAPGLPLALELGRGEVRVDLAERIPPTHRGGSFR